MPPDTEKAPFARLRAGDILSDVHPDTANASLVHVKYESGGIAVEGVAPATDVGISYKPGDALTTDVGGTNVELIHNVTFLDAPNGAKLATVDLSFKASARWFAYATKLEGPTRGFVNLRFMTDNVVIQGWVRVSDVKLNAFPPSGNTGSSGRGTTPALKQPIELPVGTILYTEARDVIGVANMKARIECAADCDAPDPLVEVLACTQTVTLRARRPRPPEGRGR
jgi:hypothetical protein